MVALKNEKKDLEYDIAVVQSLVLPLSLESIY